MNYNWNWGILFREPFLGFLISGVQTTLVLALTAWVLAFTLGSVLGVMRTLPNRGVSAVAAVYVEVFRGIPLLVWFFLWFFVVPELLPQTWGRWLKRDLPDPEFWTAVAALGLYTACRVAEQVRAGIQAIPRGQTMAAEASGMNRVQVYRYILLPLGYRRIVPVLTSEFMTIFKNSSLALTIGVMELTAQARQVESFTFQGFEAFTAATVLYVVITLTVTVIMRQVEQRTRIPGLLSAKGT